MAKPESRFRSEFNALIKPLRPISIENALTTPGIGDVFHTKGTVELKILEKWPVRDETPLRIPHYTNEQRAWASDWVNGGGCYRLVVKVGREWFVFKTPASLEVGNLTRQEMYEKAHFHSKQKPSRDELIEALIDAP